MTDQSENVPGWMKAMQNGNLAEARARAFLMNRFWILERSVDVNGADFLIQRRLTKSNFLDEQAPRLGVVQVKFFETSATVQSVHAEYVVNPEGIPRKEFFLLLHTGDEQNEGLFFLTAEDVCRDFECKKVKGLKKYIIPGRKILDMPRYKVDNKRIILDRMEHLLKLADLIQNRKFIAWSLPTANVDPDHILPDYKEPIPNWYGSIPEAFYEIKEASNRSLQTISEIYDKLVKVSESADPMTAHRILEEIRQDCQLGSGYGWAIRLSPELDQWSFWEACKRHNNQVNSLKSSGLLNAFLGLKDVFKSLLLKFLQDKLPLEKGLVHSFSFNVTEDFQILNFRNQLTNRTEFLESKKHIREFTDMGSMAVLKNKRREFLAYWLPATFIDQQLACADPNHYFQVTDLTIYLALMEAIYGENYYESDYLNLALD